MVTRFEYECMCGHSFSTDTDEAHSVKCPSCGNRIPVLNKKDDNDRLIDATFEILGEGGVIFSGAR